MAVRWLMRNKVAGSFVLVSFVFTVVSALTRNWLGFVAFLLWFVLLIGGALVSSSRGSVKELLAAVRSLPLGVLLVDADDKHALMVSRRRLLHMWAIDRYPHDSLNDAMTDFNLGAQVSTFPYRRFVVMKGRVLAADHAWPVQPDDDTNIALAPEGEDPSRIHMMKTVVFMLRSGLLNVPQQEIDELVGQLRHATPHEGDGHGR